MEWTGKVTVSSKVGRPVLIDEWSYPRGVTFSFEGEGRLPDFVARFEIRDDRPECVEIAVTSKPDGPGVSDADLKLFNLEELARRAFSAAAGRPLPFGGHATGANPRRAADHADEAAEVIRGAQDLDSQLVRVARVYLNDQHGAPLAAVERHTGQSRRTAARWVERARLAGLIPPKGASRDELAAAGAKLEASTPSSTALPVSDMNDWLGWESDDGE